MGESVRICVRVAETLKVVHAQGVLHRDIKPGNLILRDGNVDDVTLIDFGIARIGATASAITHTGVMLGTLGYMAPEQARGNKILDARADVFSLGAVLFKCLTGVPVFAADDEIGILAKMLFDAPARARSLRRDVPTSLDDLLARLMTFPNVLITSHQAFLTHEALDNIAEATLASVAEHFAGAPLTRAVRP